MTTTEDKFSKEGRVKVYAKVPFKDDQGDHRVGSEITMAYETPEQQSDVDTMIRYGVLSKTKPEKN